MDSRVGTPFFAGTVYALVSPSGNELGIDYWLGCFLEGKKTLMRSITDSKSIEFLIGAMFIKDNILHMMNEHETKVAIYLNIINQVKLYTTLQTWLLVQTSNYKQCQEITYQCYDNYFLTLSMRS